MNDGLRISTGYNEPRAFLAGERGSLLIRGAPAGSGEASQFTSSDLRVVTIEPDGHLAALHAHAPGHAVITWRSGDQRAELTIEVVDPKRIHHLELALGAGVHPRGSVRLTVHAVHARGLRTERTAEPRVRWTSSAPALGRFDPAEPGLLRLSDAEGLLQLSAELEGHAGQATFLAGDGNVHQLGEISVYGEPLVVGLATWLGVERRSALAGSTFDGRGATFSVLPPDAAELFEHDGRTAIVARRAAPLTVVARFGPLRREREQPCVAAPIALTPMRDAGDAPFVVTAVTTDSATRELSTSLKVQGVSAFAPEELNITWSSSSPEVMRVVAHGATAKAEPLTPGTAVIRAQLRSGAAVERQYEVTEAQPFNF
jgi:hypothetical protein